MTKTSPARSASPRTLCIDIGGTGIKAMVVSARGRSLTEHQRVLTPRPATPRAVLRAIAGLLPPRATYDRVSVGFPGVVVDGVIHTAVNLHPAWRGFDLQAALRKATRRPVRVLNDAGVQGFGAVQGRGVEICVTLGTGFGFSLFVDGRYVPNVEFGHHPFRRGTTYEEDLGEKGMKRHGRRKWNRLAEKAVALLQRIFNCRALYIGGGNARHLRFALPDNVRIVDNVAGLTGGVKLWDREP